MNSWEYNGQPLEEVPEGYKAFVYQIQIANKFYIGKKSFVKSIKRPPLKGYKRHRRDTVQSNWKKYCSSSDVVKNLVGEGYTPERYIMRLCKTQKEATYWETKLLFDLITVDGCINENIGGKYFKEEIIEFNKQYDTK